MNNLTYIRVIRPKMKEMKSVFGWANVLSANKKGIYVTYTAACHKGTFEIIGFPFEGSVTLSIFYSN